MGVLIEAINVVIRNATVEHHFRGGVAEYARLCPNDTFCTDGRVCRVGFMTPQDAVSFIKSLTRCGFVQPSSGGSPEVALVDAKDGFTFPCEWLQLDQVQLEPEGTAAMAWLRGTEPSELVAPPGWAPGSLKQMPLEAFLKEYEFMGNKQGVEAYRNRQTGEMLYRGRPKIVVKKKWWQVWK